MQKGAGTQLNTKTNDFAFSCRRGIEIMKDFQFYFKALFDGNQGLTTSITINDGPNLLDHSMGRVQGLSVDCEMAFFARLMIQVGHEYIFFTVEFTEETESNPEMDTIYTYDHSSETLYMFDTFAPQGESCLTHYNIKEYNRSSCTTVGNAFELRQSLNRYTDDELKRISVSGNVDEFVAPGTINAVIDLDAGTCSILGYKE